MFKRKLTLSFLIVSLLVGQACRGGGSMEAPAGSKSQPQFKPGFNLFSPQQDIQMGQQSAEQIMRETPMLNDPQIGSYISRLGNKLASKAAGERFPYSFRVVATKEINAFALPGGFLFVNAGAIAAARNEGELAGVMAHEIAHAALRHGTNQASKQRLAQLGLGVLGSIASSGEGGDLGGAVSAIGGLGANMLFLKFGRTAEKQADLEGARILAEAGYDPRDMANFFKTLQAEGGQRVPEMLSDHPDPGNRIQYILAEVPKLPVGANPVHTTPEFEQAKARLTGRAPQMSAGSQLRRIGPSNPTDLELKTRPPRPAAQFKTFQAEDGSFALQVPANWDALPGGGSNYIFSPKGAYGKMPSQSEDSMMVTHGIFVGVLNARGDLQSATQAFIQRQLETNADFQPVGQMRQTKLGGQAALAAAVAGPSAINGVAELDITYTTATVDGRMFYIITISPEDETEAYKAAFQQILNSLRLAR
ncbi:MAG TPA: M48 family metalloprotease [Blastocatellia bacterium]|nr:M48 family metalloprotease [Blastocatellia bacterium]HMX27814.1 M48 family metalloprotease [Blastocatellia bacterium]HMY73498.1 M48 family metalloprotease [Blastocatellia bacterium]HMZ20289.1 M48 family metalloprotease [Blastocatellia bacterium]HNG32547.1 M48 family metalloprotease [Blastocatellia bacterium]